MNRLSTKRPIAGTNETDFRKIIGKNNLLGKKRYSYIDSKTNQTVEISVDESFVHNNKLYLVEIDSGNEAKLLVGQYCLLNLLFNDEKYEKKDVVFLVIHYYKDYDPMRTQKNLKLVKERFNLTIPFLALYKSDFKDFASLLKLL